MRVIQFMQRAHVSASRAESAPGEVYRQVRFISTPKIVQTGRPHADDARASRPLKPQGQVNNFGHIADDKIQIFI